MVDLTPGGELAGWWIVINIIAWTTGLTLMPGFLLTGAMAGALTGLAMDLFCAIPRGENARFSIIIAKIACTLFLPILHIDPRYSAK